MRYLEYLVVKVADDGYFLNLDTLFPILDKLRYVYYQKKKKKGS